MELDRYPHNKEALLREVDVRMRIADIRQAHEIKDRLSPKWWEPVMVILLFMASLGLLASVFQFAELKDSALYRWLFFWLALMVVAMVSCFQVILFKIYSFRRANDLLMRMVEDMRKELDAIDSERRHPSEAKAGEPQHRD